MKKGMRSHADGILEKKRRSQKWKRLAGVLGCLVVFLTAYVLMRPAETLERELICGMDEHQHSVELGCYQAVVPESPQPICGLDEAGHVHSAECYSEESVLVCTEPEGDAHQHDENCYAVESVLTCEQQEAEEHTHTAECYPADDEEAETEWELVCDLPEHTHTEDCYADDAAQHAQTEEVAALIDALPSAEEVEARLAELLAAEDTAGYDAYCAELAQRVEQVNAAYEALTGEQKAQLNIDRLTALFVYLPAKEGTFSLTAAATRSGIVVTISGDITSLPFPAEELTLTAAEVEDENASTLRDEALESEDLTAAENYMLDIRLLHGDEEVQPTGSVTVTFAGLPLDKGADAAILESDDGAGSDSSADTVAYQAAEITTQAVMASTANDVDMPDEITDDTGDDAAHDESETYPTDPKVYQIDAGIQQATEIDVTVNEENNVVLETDQLTSLYSVSLLAATPRAAANAADYNSLNKALSSGSSVTLTKDITIDVGVGSLINLSYLIKVKNSPSLNLNGHTITLKASSYPKAKLRSLFYIPSGASLTITDDAVHTSDAITATTTTGAIKSASYSATSLTYSIVRSAENNATNHTTTETREDHTVSLGGGAIVGDRSADRGVFVVEGTLNIKRGYIHSFGSTAGTKSPIWVSGTLTMSGGVIADNKNGGSGGAITLTGSGKMNMSGGYICGNNTKSAGGAIYVSGNSAKLTMTGGVIAANKSSNAGGAIALAVGTFDLKGGTISGNTSTNQGGGIYCKSSSITMSGGLITCNKTTAPQADTVPTGGGGVFLDKGGKFTMSNGFITANCATMRGGGIATFYLTNDKLSEGPKATITINGGFICANKATGHEGAGINCDSGNHCLINGSSQAVYISNNRMEAAGVWGGGGIYIGHAADLKIYNSLICMNNANGLGGGYASCQTSNSFFYIGEGTAIFENTAMGNDRGTGSSDHNLHNFGAYSVATAGNPPDIFAGGKVRLYATMLKGGDPLWSGSRDGTIFSMTKDDVLCTSSTIIGLKANPSDADKTAARASAKVYITGNYSASHGAGIMSNGIVYFGEDTYTERHTPTRLDLTGTKELLQKDGVTPTAVPAETFQFTISDEKGNVISTATADSAGDITFERLLFSAAGIYTYTIKEVSSSSATIWYDPTSYTLTVTVAEEKEVINHFGTATGVYFFPTAATVINNNTGATVFASDNVHEDSTVILRSSTASDSKAFTNRLKDEEYSVNITKVDSGNQSHTLADAEFKLEVKNGTAYVPISGVVSGTAGVYTYAASGTTGAVTTFVTAENGNLQIVGIPAGEYKLTETKAPAGYLISEEWRLGKEITFSKSETPTGAYTVTVADPPATYTFQFLKVSAADKTTPVPNARYNLLDGAGKKVTFTKNGTVYQYGASGTVTDLVTDANGKFQLTELPRGSYTLREVKAAAGFGLAQDYSFTLSPETTTDRVFTYKQEEPVAYELPETGGAGTAPYVITGAALLVGAACLMACRGKRGKAGGRTS